MWFIELLVLKVFMNSFWWFSMKFNFLFIWLFIRKLVYSWHETIFRDMRVRIGAEGGRVPNSVLTEPLKVSLTNFSYSLLTVSPIMQRQCFLRRTRKVIIRSSPFRWQLISINCISETKSRLFLGSALFLSLTKIGI